MRTPRNHFKVGVRFQDHAYGIEDLGRDGEAVTPEIVLTELEAFCRRVRRDIEQRGAAPTRTPDEEQR